MQIKKISLSIFVLFFPFCSLTHAEINSLNTNSGSANIIHEEISLRGLNLNNSGEQVRVVPNQIIPAVVDFTYRCPSCFSNSQNQIIVGIANIGAQSCIYHGGPKGEGRTFFKIVAPAQPGVYSVRFRDAHAVDCKNAVAHWWSMGGQPGEAATVGTIIVTNGP